MSVAASESSADVSHEDGMSERGRSHERARGSAQIAPAARKCVAWAGEKAPPNKPSSRCRMMSH